MVGRKSGGTRMLVKIGDAMRLHRATILVVQWVVVSFYFFLLVIPAFMPLRQEDSHLYNNLRLFVQFLIWGIWWPFVMLSTMLLGRVWCGVLCPDGTLTEFASRHGKGRSIPRWMRWDGWPLTTFVCVTIYGQLISVYGYPQAALLILGGSSVAAVTVGFFFGVEKRVWCRYLCPVSGVFSLLAKIAPVHFRVDQEIWKHDTTHQPMVNCAPLIDIRHMKSASMCHACGRCSGYKGAVSLAGRSPASEVLNTGNHDVKTAEALTLVFGVIGIASAALRWSTSSTFMQVKNAVVNHLIRHNSFLLLQDDAPWWMLTHYPSANDVFTWLDGLCILIFVLGGGFALGLTVLTTIWLAARLADHPELSWQRLSLSLVPIAGVGIFLGLSTLTLSHLKAEGITPAWIPIVRVGFLAIGSGFSAYLSWRLIAIGFSVRRMLAFSIGLLPIALINSIWAAAFFG